MPKRISQSIFHFLFILAMYVSEILPELDKVNKMLAQQQETCCTGNATGFSNGVQSTVKSSNQSVKAINHDALMAHPSELLIEFKVRQ